MRLRHEKLQAVARKAAKRDEKDRQRELERSGKTAVFSENGNAHNVRPPALDTSPLL